MLLSCVILLIMPTDDWKQLATDAARAEAVGRYDEAKKLLDAAITQEPKQAGLFSQRGGVHFKLGLIKESLADFNQQIKLQPREAAAHWRRGLTLYYAEQFADGVAQFITSDQAEPEDVENAVWHLLCNARVKGVQAARQEVLKVSQDSRVPMLEVHALFAGLGSIEKVLAAAEAGEVSQAERQSRRFYAYLYCGLYEEMMGQKAVSLEKIKKAVNEYPVQHYMLDVGKVHVLLRSR